VAVAKTRDVETLTRGLQGWFAARHPQWSDVTLELTRPQPGMSSETLFVEVRHDGTAQSYVVRLPPLSAGLFPDYDLGVQARVQAAVRGAGIAVPTTIYESSSQALGCPFVVMPKVDGRTLSTQPHYIARSWLREQSSPEQQQTLLRSLLQTMALVHRLPWQELDLGPLSGGGPGLVDSIAWWESYVDWATPRQEWAAPYVRALAWCRAHVPTAVPDTSLLWGDPQLVNLVIAEDHTPAAVLDWEMAGLGPAEVDLAWFLTLHELSAERLGGDLPGFGDRQWMIDTYAEALGRDVADLHFYEVFAHVRSGAIVLRAGQLMAEAGLDPRWMINAPQLAHLERLTRD
jgi:aminoglycoside phosphotransferase (APT) family kinase protein